MPIPIPADAARTVRAFLWPAGWGGGPGAVARQFQKMGTVHLKQRCGCETKRAKKKKGWGRGRGGAGGGGGERSEHEASAVLEKHEKY